MPGSLYEQDALAWSEQQASLLRRLAAGERVNEAVDWSNVIEEVHDSGLSELHACESVLEQALRHLIKLRVWPDSRSAPHWRGEVAVFLAGARRRFSASMKQRIDVAAIYADAFRAVEIEHDALGFEVVDQQCPYAIDDLISDRPDVAGLLSRFRGTGT